MDEFDQICEQATPGLQVAVPSQGVAGTFVSADVAARTVDLITPGGPLTVAFPKEDSE